MKSKLSSSSSHVPGHKANCGSTRVDDDCHYTASNPATIVVIMKLPRLLLLLLLHMPLVQPNLSLISAPQQRLVADILHHYDEKVRPIRKADQPIVVTFSMDLYQIIEVNEPKQYIMLTAWIIERWRDELLFWDPDEYSSIGDINLPHNVVWLPDTMLYNSLIMKDDEARRLLNVKLKTNTSDRSVHVELLYPTLYKFSCSMNLHYFPFDSQVCNMTFGSWTYDNDHIDYVTFSNHVGMSSYLENEDWIVVSFAAVQRQLKYACCSHNYTNLDFVLHIKRKPLFYLVNLVIPTSIITVISIVGFFVSSSSNGERQEKISLGITTLLSMSIMMLMVSDQMPTTSTFIPLIVWFYLSMILLISIGTVTSSAIIGIQRMGRLGHRLSKRIVHITVLLSNFACIRIPNHIQPSDETDFGTGKLSISILFGRSQKDQPNITKYDNNENSLDKTGTAIRKKSLLVADQQNRHMTAIEFDWLANVLERMAFFFFLLLFLCLFIGINWLGFNHWLT